MSMIKALGKYAEISDALEIKTAPAPTVTYDHGPSL